MKVWHFLVEVHGETLHEHEAAFHSLANLAWVQSVTSMSAVTQETLDRMLLRSESVQPKRTRKRKVA